MDEHLNQYWDSIGTSLGKRYWFDIGVPMLGQHFVPSTLGDPNDTTLSQAVPKEVWPPGCAPQDRGEMVSWVGNELDYTQYTVYQTQFFLQLRTD